MIVPVDRWVYMLYVVDQSVSQSRCTCLVLSSKWTS